MRVDDRLMLNANGSARGNDRNKGRCVSETKEFCLALTHEISSNWQNADSEI